MLSSSSALALSLAPYPACQSVSHVVLVASVSSEALAAACPTFMRPFTTQTQSDFFPSCLELACYCPHPRLSLLPDAAESLAIQLSSLRSSHFSRRPQHEIFSTPLTPLISSFLHDITRPARAPRLATGLWNSMRLGVVSVANGQPRSKNKQPLFLLRPPRHRCLCFTPAGHCKMLAPTWDALAKDLKGEVNVAKVKQLSDYWPEKKIVLRCLVI